MLRVPPQWHLNSRLTQQLDRFAGAPKCRIDPDRDGIQQHSETRGESSPGRLDARLRCHGSVRSGMLRVRCWSQWGCEGSSYVTTARIPMNRHRQCTMPMTQFPGKRFQLPTLVTVHRNRLVHQHHQIDRIWTASSFWRVDDGKTGHAHAARSHQNCHGGVFFIKTQLHMA